MRPLHILCIVACVALPTTMAFARGGGMGGGMGSHSMSVTGGEFGTGAARPGTNSLGTALPSDMGGHPMKGPPLGTSAAIDREDARLEKMLEGSICRGC